MFGERTQDNDTVGSSRQCALAQPRLDERKCEPAAPQRLRRAAGELREMRDITAVTALCCYISPTDRCVRVAHLQYSALGTLTT